MVTINRVPDLAAVAATAARRLISVVSHIQHSGGGFHDDGIARVVVTGGTAGIRTLAEIRALEEDSPTIDWDRIHIFFGDERNVPVNHEDSNEGQARKALLDHVAIPANHVHGYQLGDRPMSEAVADYTDTLAAVAPRGFDLHLLGLGPEGHINTLFPHTAAVAETTHLVIAEYHSPKPPAERVTLTLPAVARAQRVWFLVSGAEKAQAAAHIVAGSDPQEWPAAGAHGQQETVMFLADDAAAQLPSAE